MFLAPNMWIVYSSRSEGRRPERSEVNKFVGPKARRRLRSGAKPCEFEPNIYLYICMYVCLYISVKVSVLLPGNSAQTKYE